MSVSIGQNVLLKINPGPEFILYDGPKLNKWK